MRKRTLIVAALASCVVFSNFALAQGPAPTSAQAPAPAAPEQEYAPQFVVTYIEVTPKSAKATAAALIKYRQASQKMSGAKMFEVFQRIGTPNQFSVVSTWENTKAYAAQRDGAEATAFRKTIEPDLIAAYDERPHHTLSVGKPLAAGGGLVIVTHVDFVARFAEPGLQSVKELADKGRAAGGNVRFDALTQTSRPNHVTLVQVWKDMKAYEAEIVSAEATGFRKSLLARSGSPYDERLYKALK